MVTSSRKYYYKIWNIVFEILSPKFNSPKIHGPEVEFGRQVVGSIITKFEILLP